MYTVSDRPHWRGPQVVIEAQRYEADWQAARSVRVVTRYLRYRDGYKVQDDPNGFNRGEGTGYGTQDHHPRRYQRVDLRGNQHIREFNNLRKRLERSRLDDWNDATWKDDMDIAVHETY